jgi:hypothetical protein
MGRFSKDKKGMGLWRSRSRGRFRAEILFWRKKDNVLGAADSMKANGAFL